MAAAMQYVAKDKAHVVREKKQVVIDRELDRIYKRDGTVSAELLVEEAKAETSPLHKFFEWNDEEAAARYRLAQATSMILASKMIVVLESSRGNQATAVSATRLPEVRRYLSPGRKEPRKLRNEALNDVDVRKAVIDRRVAVLRSWCKEAIDIEELAELRKLIIERISVFG